MNKPDTVIRNGRVLTSQSDGTADIAVIDGQITKVGQNLPTGHDEIDATGMIVTPGGVDAHCHIEQLSGMGLMNADTFETATRSALLGGTTTTVSFVPQTEATLTASIDDYARRASAGAKTDYAFHLILSDLSDEETRGQLRNAIRAGHRSVKLFTTYNIQLSDRDICDVLSIARDEGALVCVHAENDGLIGWTKDMLLANGKTKPRHHSVSHPRLAELEAVERLIRFAEFFATPVMLFHISTREAVDAIRVAKTRGVPVWAETCPHYLFMDAGILDQPDNEGAKWMCSPPQRTTDDHAALWEGLADGTIALVSSDHAPYRFDETGKLYAGPDAPFSQVANGLPGLEPRMPLMIDAMLNGRIGGTDFVDICCQAPARLHGLPHKGDIAPGYHADIVLWDPKADRTFADNDLNDNVGYNPWVGHRVMAWPQCVLLRGQPVVEAGKLVTRPPAGQWIPRPKLGIQTDAVPAAEYIEATR